MRTYEQANAVAIGSFNPAIFHPKWFETNKILPSAEIDFALSKGGEASLVVTREVTQVQFESLLLKVTQERFELFTERPDWTKDIGPILSSIFQALLHTPVSILGFNVITHRPVPSRDAILARWLPLSPLVAAVGESDAQAGLPKVSASVKAKWDGYRALLTMEASAKVANGIHLNQNFETSLSGGARELVTIAQRDWLRVLKRAETVALMIVEASP